MSLLIDLVFKKCYTEYIKEILLYATMYKPYIENINLQPLNINLLDQNLYIVNNLKPFLSSVEKIGYEITKGPKKLKGQIKSLSYKLLFKSKF